MWVGGGGGGGEACVFFLFWPLEQVLHVRTPPTGVSCVGGVGVWVWAGSSSIGVVVVVVVVIVGCSMTLGQVN